MDHDEVAARGVALADRVDALLGDEPNPVAIVALTAVLIATIQEMLDAPFEEALEELIADLEELQISFSGGVIKSEPLDPVS